MTFSSPLFLKTPIHSAWSKSQFAPQSLIGLPAHTLQHSSPAPAFSAGDASTSFKCPQNPSNCGLN